MEIYPSSSISSPTSKHASINNLEKLLTEIPHQPREQKECSSSLHSVRKAPGKKPLTKMHIAPFPPMKTKVYKVKPADFKDIVQKLTGALPYSPPGRLQAMAPPPLNLDISPVDQPSNNYIKANNGSEMEVAISPLSALYKELTENAVDDIAPRISDSFAATSGWFSPSISSTTTTWFSIPFQSPGTLSVLEQNAAAL